VRARLFAGRFRSSMLVCLTVRLGEGLGSDGRSWERERECKVGESGGGRASTLMGRLC
jgi:hypothetical protein